MSGILKTVEEVEVREVALLETDEPIELDWSLVVEDLSWMLLDPCCRPNIPRFLRLSLRRQSPQSRWVA